MPRDIEAPFNPLEEISVRNLGLLREKIAQMKAEGREKMAVLADFDYTLTRRTLGDLKADNSFKVLENVTRPAIA